MSWEKARDEVAKQHGATERRQSKFDSFKAGADFGRAFRREELGKVKEALKFAAQNLKYSNRIGGQNDKFCDGVDSIPKVLAILEELLK